MMNLNEIQNGCQPSVLQKTASLISVCLYLSPPLSLSVSLSLPEA